MDHQTKHRYVRNYEGLRAKARSIREDPEKEAAELERTADYLEAQMPVIFPAEKAERQPRVQPKKPKGPVTAKQDRGHYADDLHQFLADHGPAQISKDIVPHLRSIHGDTIEPEPVRKLLKRAHWSRKSLVMRSPEHEQGEGVYMLAKSIDEKEKAFPQVFIERPTPDDSAEVEGKSEEAERDA